MTRPNRYLLRMIAFCALALLVAAVLHRALLHAFATNPALNGLILATILFGVFYAFRQVLMLLPEIEWVEQFRRAQPGLAQPATPDLLAPVATMLGERQGRVSLSTMSTRSLLDSIGARLDERRELVRYLTGLLVFLGLLGTFWGLLDTVSAVGGTIQGLRIEQDDLPGFLGNLQRGLSAPLAGMGIAFSSSLFGLSGSLVLGFLELQASQAQNRFYNDFEEWLSTHTRLGAGGGLGEGDQSVPAYVQALLEQTADSLDNLQRAIARSEEGRGTTQHALHQVTEQLAGLADRMRAEQELLVRMAEAQMTLKPALDRLVSATEQQDRGLDEASRTHLRNLDLHVLRLIESVQESRAQTVADLRSELKLLARTIAALGEDWLRESRERSRR